MPACDASSTSSCSYFRSSASGVVQELQATNDVKDPECICIEITDGRGGRVGRDPKKNTHKCDQQFEDKLTSR